MAKRESKISPPGVMRFGWLDKPDVKFNPEGKFHVELEMDPEDATVKAFIGPMAAYAAEKKIKNMPWKPIDGGLISVKFATAYKPRCFDAANRPIPDGVQIGRGSTLKVSYQSNVYPAFGGGINLYLIAVQVVDFKAYAADGAEFGFEASEDAPETGFTPADTGDGPPTGKEPEDDSPLPF